MKYLLPCSCGKSVAVEVSLAGQTVRCACGNVLEVPAMRLIRQLPMADAATSNRPPRDLSWSLPQGLLFAVGLALMVGGLATAAYFQLGRARLDTDEKPWDNIAQAHRTIDQMNIDQTWELWKIVRTERIGPYVPPAFVMYRYVSAYWLKNVISGMVVAVVGLVVMLSAFFARSKAKSRRRPTR
jgi:hypothetical protein